MKILITSIVLLLTKCNAYFQYKEQLLKISESNISNLNSNIYNTQKDAPLKNEVESFNWDYNNISFL